MYDNNTYYNTDAEDMTLDPEMFSEKEYQYSMSSSSISQHQWPSNIQKQDGRILFVDAITQPSYFSELMDSHDYKNHKDVLY